MNFIINNGDIIACLIVLFTILIAQIFGELRWNKIKRKAELQWDEVVKKVYIENKEVRILE